jgi:hypothetical protein
MRKSVLFLSGLLVLSACGGGTSSKIVPVLSVSVTPSAQTHIDEAQTLNFAATVSNDSSAKGVTWAVAGTGCSGTACGTLTNPTTSAVTYAAPASVTANMTVTVQATSVADTSKSMSTTVVVSPEPAIMTTSLTGGAVGKAYSANLQASGGAGTLSWTLDSASSLPAGLSLSSAGVISGTPTATGSKTFSVKVTDASAGHEGTCSQTKQLSLTIAPPAILVSLAPSQTTNLDQSQTVPFTATVSNDSANKGVTWAVSGTTCTGAACGTFTNSAALATTYNAPATVTSNLTVTVQAFSVADTTKSAATSLVVSPAPSITTTTLTNGAVNTVYAATLQATGGAGSLTWSLASGSSLPAGLALSNAGVISGTPTTAGTTSFTVKATDASQGQPGPVSATQLLSFTIAPAALVITTTSLPQGVEGAAYSQTMQASGGTPPYAWTVSSGSTLPSWLKLTSGTLSGTPTETGSFPFSLTVTDSTKPTAQSKSQSFTLTISAAAACGSGNESILKGQYAFSLSGYTPSGFLAAIGSFSADGNGHITAGTVDSNGSLGVKTGSITASGSSYSVGSDNRGCATIATPFYTFITRFALATPSANVSAGGVIEEWESGSSAYIAAGQILLQQSIPTALPSGTWVYEQTGIYGTNQYRTASVGTLTVSGGKFTKGEYDSNVAGVHKNYTGLTGTFTSPDKTTGRYTTATTLSGVTVNHAAYLVSSTQYIQLSTEASGSTTAILIADGQLQSGALTISGKMAFYGAGKNSSGAGNTVQFGLANATSSSALTATVYEDDAGTWNTPNPVTASCNYAIDSYGRVTLSGANCATAPPVFYLTGPNTGVMEATDSGVLIGQLRPQSATAVKPGTYMLGTQEVVDYSIETGVGVATLTSAGITGTVDLTSDSSPQQEDQPLSETVTVGSDGTFSTSDHPGLIVGVVISNSQIAVVHNVNSTYPTMLMVSTVPAK